MAHERVASLAPSADPIVQGTQPHPATIVGVDHATFAVLCDAVDDALVLHQSLKAKHHNLVAVQAWRDILNSASFAVLMMSPSFIAVQATADAMATTDLAGLGGAAFFEDGTSVWFQFYITLIEAKEMWTWVGSDMQKHSAVYCWRNSCLQVASTPTCLCQDHQSDATKDVITALQMLLLPKVLP
eukprot:s2809_g9.t1